VLKPLYLFRFSFLLLSLLLLGKVSAQEDFHLQGQLIQGTLDGAPLTDGLPLQLNILTTTGEQVESLNSFSQSDGTFSFENVPAYPDHFYVVAATWAGIEQSSYPVKYEALPEILEFPLYEITDQLSEVVSNGGNLRIEFTDVNQVGIQMLLEVEYLNLSDRIIISDQATVELPVGAYGVAPQQAANTVQRFEVVNTSSDLPIPGIVDTQPLVPTWANVLRASFFVPYQDGAVVDMRFPFAVTNFGVFVRVDTVSVESNILSLTNEQQTSSGRVYRLYEQTQPLAPGEPFRFTLLGKPIQTVRSSPGQASDNTTSSATFLLIFGVGTLIVFLGLMTWLVRARQTESKTP
jgi:hypothetical protein